MTPAEKKLRVLYNGVRENPRFPHREAGQRVRAQVGHADKFKDALVRSGLYIDRIRKILDAENVPADLACLPLVESSFNPHAASYVGAVGIWQFMLRTAKRYDLTVTAFIDERSNVEKSTVAAARLLSDNYKSLKSWPLAITAYNHGAGGVRNAVKKAGSRNIADIIDSYKTRRFGFSSRNFYAEFIAARNVYYNAKRYFGDIQFEPPLITTSVTIPDFVTIESLQRYCGLSPKTIRTLNPALQPIVFQPGGVIPKGYTLNIPKTDTDTFFNLYAMIPQPLKYDVTPVRLKHKVRKGETLSEIARMYGVSVSDFQRANNIRNPQRVLAGTRLIVPGAFDTPAGDPKRDTGAQPETEAAGRRHKIRPGETLSEIALKYNTTVQTFKRINGIRNPAEIQAGQILKIPEG
jgi:membrane-bound lytic murein transglycosylase D